MVIAPLCILTPEMSRAKTTILLVEDDQSIAQLYAMKLRMDGYQVDIAADSATAAIVYERTRPAIVCVDSRLPDGPGRDVVSAMLDRGAVVVLLTNDQEAYEHPPAGVAAALLKMRTTPALLSSTIGDLVATRQRSSAK